MNVVSPVEGWAKALDVPLVMTGEFATVLGAGLRSPGRHELRGLGGSYELLTCH